MDVAFSPTPGQAMSEPTTHLVTQLLDAARTGTPGARDRLWEVIYGELRRLASAEMAREAPGRTMQTTALIHEAYLRLMAAGDGCLQSRQYFFGAAAQAMRRILVEDARRRGTLKRGGESRGGRLDLDATGCAPAQEDGLDMLALDEALGRLETEYPELAELVQLRYFTGLSIDQTAEILAIAPRTVDARWQTARAWLRRALGDGEPVRDRT
jgi:RNA polymerase sigma factor (TIGR02999 family)